MGKADTKENMNKILGITNDVTQCECCGRNDLKSTVIIATEDSIIIGYFGSTCATNYVAGTGAEIEKRAKRVTRERNAMKAEIDQQVASIMATERDLINLEIDATTDHELTERRHLLCMRDEIDAEIRRARLVDGEAHAIDGDRALAREIPRKRSRTTKAHADRAGIARNIEHGADTIDMP